MTVHAKRRLKATLEARNPVATVNQKLTPDEQLTEELANFYGDPLGYVMFCFPWDTDASIQMCELAEPWRSKYNCQYGPDEWACKFLDKLGEEIRERKFDGRNAVEPIRFATVSGHGIGKTTLTAFLIKFIMDTRPFCKGTVTAMTQPQLQTKTWAELGKWHRLSLTAHWFDYHSGRNALKLEHKKYLKEWSCAAQTSKEENSESFAGQHSVNSTSFYIFDEASGIPEKIYEVREGGTTDGEPMVFDFGNGTRNSGRFYDECEINKNDRFIVTKIDSRSVKITNKKLFHEWIDDFGEDSDFVKVRVRGMFPAAGSCQFIPTDQVAEAMSREVSRDTTAQLVIGVDVARFGDDDSVIWPRIGMDARTWPRKRLKGADVVQVAGQVMNMVRDFKQLGVPCKAIFVDGGGVGGGVVDILKHAGYPVIEVHFQHKPIDPQMYRWRIDEMWGLLREAIKNRLCLPLDSDIKSQLTSREYGMTTVGNKINLESKDALKERGLPSPDDADALAVTFYMELAPVGAAGLGQSLTTVNEYDPLSETW